MSWILVRGGHLFAPEDRGIQDLLMIDGRIVAIGANLPELHELYPLEIVDAQDQIVLPGLIDPHLHIIGASGLGGPTTRTTDLQISCIAGVGSPRSFLLLVQTALVEPSLTSSQEPCKWRQKGSPPIVIQEGGGIPSLLLWVIPCQM